MHFLTFKNRWGSGFFNEVTAQTRLICSTIQTDDPEVTITDRRFARLPESVRA